MATSELVRPHVVDRDTAPSRQISANTFAISHVISALASLRLTVVLFAASLFLIFVGTLAQKDQDVWRVVNDTYFRVWFAHVTYTSSVDSLSSLTKTSTGTSPVTSTSSAANSSDYVFW